MTPLSRGCQTLSAGTDVGEQLRGGGNPHVATHRLEPPTGEQKTLHEPCFPLSRWGESY